MMFFRQIQTFEDARWQASRRLPRMVFDYIDGAAGQGQGEAENRRLLRAIRLQTSILVNVENRSLDVDVFDHKSTRPFGVSPMGMCNLTTPGADLMLARQAARYRSPVGVSTVSSTSLETMIEAADGYAWFQFYFSGDGSVVNRLIERARVADYRTLVVTVDVAEVGRRPRELQRGFKMPFHIGVQQFIDFALHPSWALSTLKHGKPDMANFGEQHGHFDRTASRARADWQDLQRIRDQWRGNLVVKGVLNTDDAVRLKTLGVDAIQVSSHGGRQLDSAPHPILALRDIRAAVGADYPLYYDSGIQSGEDVLTAYAMGADFVFLGRSVLFALAAGGEQGLAQMWDIFSQETSIGMAQLGLSSLRQRPVVAEQRIVGADVPGPPSHAG